MTMIRSRSFVMVLAAVLCSCVPGQSQERCPWLNVATASGFLDGPATLTMEKPGVAETDCIFRRQDAAAVDILQVDVLQRQDVSKGIVPEQSTCTGPRTPVRAIGNEALLCADDSKAQRGEEIIGRVRDNVFIVRFTTSSRSVAAVSREVMEQKAKETGEQIAGALF